MLLALTGSVLLIVLVAITGFILWMWSKPGGELNALRAARPGRAEPSRRPREGDSCRDS